MALLGYKPRFVEPLLSGQKDGTIRAIRKYPIVPGERLYHYTGLRTKYCKKIGESECISVEPIKIMINSGCVLLPNSFFSSTNWLDQFARRDGFENWEDMKAFWIEEHGAKKNGRKVMLVPFEGIHIRHTKIERALGNLGHYLTHEFNPGVINEERK